MSTSIAFPDHQIDPRKKDEKWILQYAKAAWNNFNKAMPTGSIFYSKRERYAEIRDYAMGKQSTTKYKKELLSEDSQDGSYMRIDWTPRTDGAVIRNIAVAKLCKAGYNILATPINAEAKDAEDEMYAQLKAKILLREALEKRDPELANNPQLQRLPGEPEDLEELKMQIDFNPKLVRAKDIEESLQLVFYENEMDKVLDAISEDVVDFGVGIVKEGLDENNKVVIRKVMPDTFICSYSNFSDFSDISFAGEVVPVKLSNLSKFFDEDKLAQIQIKVAGTNGNPSTFGDNTASNNGYDIFKADVLDLEFISYNKRVTEENKDKNGNLRISKTDPKNANKNPERFNAKTVECVYKCKWVVGTDLLYDFGVAENQKRTMNISSMSKTKLSYHIQAASFYKMKATGLTEAMIPIIDDLNLATYKLRNFRNRMIPNGFDIDLAAIEDVALGAGGEKMKPADIIDMFFETGVLISRRSGISMDSNVNYKAINPISNNMADQLMSLMQDIAASKQALRDITGLNELTDGSTPNPKTLTTIANLANESTNNALYYLVNARKKIIENTARATVQRLAIAIKRGAYDGYNKEAGRWITVPKSIAAYDYDIMIEDRPGDEQKQFIYSLMQEDIRNGFISHSEVVNIIYTNNLKHTAILLSYKVEKGKQKKDDMALRNTNNTAQAAIESNRAAEQLKDEMAQKQHERDMEKTELEKMWDLMIQKEKNNTANLAVETKAITEITKQSIANGVPLPQMPQEQIPMEEEMQEPMPEM